MLPDRHAPTQETEPANAPTGQDLPSCSTTGSAEPQPPEDAGFPVEVPGVRLLWTDDDQEKSEIAAARDAG